MKKYLLCLYFARMQSHVLSFDIALMAFPMFNSCFTTLLSRLLAAEMSLSGCKIVKNDGYQISRRNPSLYHWAGGGSPRSAISYYSPDGVPMVSGTRPLPVELEKGPSESS